MNAPLNHTSLTRSIAEADFALARSQCIDAFARLEHCVALAAKRLELPVTKDCLGRRVAALAKAKRGPKLSTANEAKLLLWVHQIEPLTAKRAWLVHSRMELGDFDGEWRASFANVVDLVTENTTVMLASVNDLKKLRNAVQNQTKQLDTLIWGVAPSQPKAQPNPQAQPSPDGHLQPVADI